MARQNKVGAMGLRYAGCALLLISVLGVSGCNQYFERQDPISLGAGNAIAQNKVTQTINPWPPGSENPRHVSNGARALIAVRRYEKNESIEPEAIGTQAVTKDDK